MSTLRLRAAVALVLAAFTAACGDSGSTGPSFPDSVSTADADSAADGSASAATFLAQNLNFGNPGIGFSQAMYSRIQAHPEMVMARSRMDHLRLIDPARLDWRTLARPEGLQAAAGEGCTFSGHGMYEFPFGDPVDQNENGIADDVLIEISCVETAGDESYTETVRLSMKEIEGSLWGMVVKVRSIERWENGDEDFEEEAIDQNATIDVRSGGAETFQEVEVWYREEFAGDLYEQGLGERWSADFDPDGAIALGSDLPDGDLVLSGRRFKFETDGPSASFEISTPTALAYDAACAAVPTNPPFTAGVLLGELNGNSSSASFEVTFTACGSYTVDVDGAYDEPVVVTAGR